MRAPAAESADRDPGPPPTIAEPERLRAAILGWYRTTGRRLGFRETNDPYAILVSETMAQQTQIGRVTNHWRRFLVQFPTLQALAAARTADVLRAWRGLGYNRRALNLQRCARVVVEAHGGRLPSDVGVLERLPGIGPYTARAVAALAFGAPVGAVDVNVRRVLSRVTMSGEDREPGARAVQAIADAIVPPDGPAEWTHAVMDVGATFCRARAPRCDECPARGVCRYAHERASASREAPGLRVSQVRRASASLPATRFRSAPFPSTRRWLRGRILDRMRDAIDDGWCGFDEPIGEHGRDAVAAALAELARDGLAELDATDSRRGRLPIY